MIPALSKLRFFNDIQKAWKVQWPSGEEERRASVREEEKEWKRVILLKGRFEEVERLVALRGTLLRLLVDNSKQETSSALLLSPYLIDLASWARKNGKLSIAYSAITQLRLLQRLRLGVEGSSTSYGVAVEAASVTKSQAEDVDKKQEKHISFASTLASKRNGQASAMHYEEAKILWLSNEKENALKVLKKLVNDRQVKSVQCWEAQVLFLIGKFSCVKRLESNQNIEKTLNRCTLLFEKREKKAKAFFVLAKFCDSIYTSLTTQMESMEWKTGEELRKQKEEEYSKFVKHLSLPKAMEEQKKEISRHAVALRKQIDSEVREENKMKEEWKRSLLEAFKNYLLCLGLGIDMEEVVFRLCSLWFNHRDILAINVLINKNVKNVSGHNFLKLFYQIASRIGERKSSFGKIIFALNKKICASYPHHSLFQLLALKNGNLVPEKMKGRSNLVVENVKIKAATDLLSELESTSPYLRKLIGEMSSLASAYIELAFYTIPQNFAKERFTPIPLIGSLSKISHLEYTAIPTAEIPLLPEQQLSGLDSNGAPLSLRFPTLLGFEKTFKLVGGLNLPKVIDCLGSDGKKYRQLVKGNDDLRQDAVMQQFFVMVNTLLTRNPKTRKRGLHVRTYKVIPLSPCSGIVEWVNDTQQIGCYLVGVNGSWERQTSAHTRYRPQDYQSHECRKMLSDAVEKLPVYQDICEHFRPVFHHFFLEKWPEPNLWLEKRLRYTRSVATNSMVGYIVGLGDRHAQNILIDMNTADIVHIDLGVAFEQGKQLRVPEIIPFRLTRDIVDGMGITGTEGVFRRCCEETMNVLRENHECLLTIVEVFVYDPLYKWTLSPLRAFQNQKQPAATPSTPSSRLNAPPNDPFSQQEARTVLNVIKQKLKGYEYGEALTVEAQVNQLINEATDPERLSRLYAGWSPWSEKILTLLKFSCLTFFKQDLITKRVVFGM